MKLLIIAAIAAVGLLVAMTGIQRAHSLLTTGRAGTESQSTLQDVQSARNDKLPVDDFEDHSLVFPRESKR